MSSLSSSAPSEFDQVRLTDVNRILGGVARGLASLKLTVGLFVAGMVLVFVGTLAQDEQNMFEVKRDYFNSWVSYIPLDVFVPQPFKPHSKPYFGGIGFPFPGGALVGTLLLVNLIAAKLFRFKLVASRSRRIWGFIFCLIGIGLVFGVIYVAQAGEGLQGRPPMSSSALWNLFRWLLVVSGVGLIWLAHNWREHRVLSRVAWVASFGLIATGVVALLVHWQPSDPSLRILWQFLQAGVVGIPLLIGLTIAFGQRGGNVLIHFGVGLLMLGQFIFADRQLEQRLVLVEQEATNVLRNQDAVELAVVDRSDPDQDRVISIPAARLISAMDSGKPIHDPRLPFDIEVVNYFVNSQLAEAAPSIENPADRGIGTKLLAKSKEKIGGAASGMNLASAYVRLLDKDRHSLGTYLVSQYLSDWKLMARQSTATEEYDPVTVEGKPFEIGLRFQRIPKPFWIKLEEVRRINYSGSETPRDYSSNVLIVDPQTGEECRERIWMNNPLRYRGETYYQSSYDRLDDGKEITGLQVVANDGWMIPYICCMLVLLGMVVHFSDTLLRFAGREERAKREPTPLSHPAFFSALAIASLLLLALVFPRGTGPEGFDLYKAGQIPVWFGGRAMPLDSLAQQTLQSASNKTKLGLPEEIRAQFGDKLDPGRSLSAIQWLLEIASGSERVEKLPIFRIDAQSVLDDLGLDRQPSQRYSVSQLRNVYDKFRDSVEQASKTKQERPEELTFEQRKYLELDQRVRAFTLLDAAFAPLPWDQVSENVDKEQLRAHFAGIVQRVRQIERMNAPAILPPSQNAPSDEKGNRPPWTILCSARLDHYLRDVLPSDPAPGLDTFEEVLSAYRNGDAARFNRAVDQHLATVKKEAPRDFNVRILGVESWLRATNPFNTASIFYIFLAVISLLAFAVAGNRLRPVVFGMLLAILVLHTAALIARMYVTQRAPVINLYSSAVFIGWAIVLAGLIFELIFRNGIGSLVASIAGGASLMVAYGLDEGDTMGVLQAVLDTQFWLSTHVVTIALGYSATFLAGLLGIIYLLKSIYRSDSGTERTGQAKDNFLRDIHRMTYGVVCFSILFSFVGTVLGGLWADDSWGRFWGWDPKENGALLIVIWNALMLHARWDKMVGERGFAMLAVFGNVVTAWSWFGTNQLGIGLHSYGFTNGVLVGLGVFAVSQLAIIAAAFRLSRQ